MAEEAPPPDGEPPGKGPAHWSFGTTADVGIGARAPSPGELFDQLGQGFTELVTDLSSVRPRTRREVRAEADTPEGLVVAFLGELIALFDEEGFLGRQFHAKLSGDPPRSVAATVDGEDYDPDRHPVHVQVKAATLHHLLVDLVRGRVEVIVDI